MSKSASKIKREAAELFKNVAVQDNTRDREFSGVSTKHVVDIYKDWRKGNKEQLKKEMDALRQWPPTEESKALGKQFFTRFMGANMPMKQVGGVVNAATIPKSKIIDMADDAGYASNRTPAVGYSTKAMTQALPRLPAAGIAKRLSLAAPQTMPPAAIPQIAQQAVERRIFTRDEAELLEAQGLVWADDAGEWITFYPEENQWEAVNPDDYLTEERVQLFWGDVIERRGMEQAMQGDDPQFWIFDDYEGVPIPLPIPPPLTDYFASVDGFAGLQPGVRKVIEKLPNSFDEKTLMSSLKGLKKAEINALDLDSISGIVRDGKIRKADFAKFAEEKISGATKNSTFNNNNTSYRGYTTSGNNYVEHTLSLGDRFTVPRELKSPHSFIFGRDTKTQDNLYGWLRASQDGDAYRIEEIQSDIAQNSPKELLRKAHKSFSGSVDEYNARLDNFYRNPYRDSEEVADMSLSGPAGKVWSAKRSLKSARDYLDSSGGRATTNFLNNSPVQDFTEAALNRAILDTVKSGKNKIQLVSGQTHGKRWGDDPQRNAGLIDYYDVKVPNLLNKLLRKHGAFEVREVPGGQRGNGRGMFKEWMLSPEAIESIRKRGVDMFSLATLNSQGLA